METHPIVDPTKLKLDGSNANVNVDIGAFDFSATDGDFSGTVCIVTEYVNNFFFDLIDGGTW